MIYQTEVEFVVRLSQQVLTDVAYLKEMLPPKSNAEVVKC